MTEFLMSRRLEACASALNEAGISSVGELSTLSDGQVSSLKVSIGLRLRLARVLRELKATQNQWKTTVLIPCGVFTQTDSQVCTRCGTLIETVEGVKGNTFCSIECLKYIRRSESLRSNKKPERKASVKSGQSKKEEEGTERYLPAPEIMYGITMQRTIQPRVLVKTKNRIGREDWLKGW